MLDVYPQEPRVSQWNAPARAPTFYKKMNCTAEVGECQSGTGIPKGSLIKFRGPVGSSAFPNMTFSNLEELFNPGGRMGFANSGTALQSLQLDGCLRPGQDVSKVLATASPLIVNLRNNSLVGEITEANAMAFNPNMIYLDLSHNAITGKIPKRLGELMWNSGERYGEGLQVLDLSHNQFDELDTAVWRSCVFDGYSQWGRFCRGIPPHSCSAMADGHVMWNMRCVDCAPSSSYSLSFSTTSMALGISLSVSLMGGGAFLASVNKEQIPKVIAFASICLAQFGPINLVRSLRVDFSEVVERFSSYGEKVSASPLDLFNLACWIPDGASTTILNFFYLSSFTVVLNFLYILIVVFSLFSSKGGESIRKVTMVFLSLGLPQGIKNVGMIVVFLGKYLDTDYLCPALTGKACTGGGTLQFVMMIQQIGIILFFILCFQTMVIIPFTLNEELDSLFKEKDGETEDAGSSCGSSLRALGLVNIKEREVMEERLGFMTKRFKKTNKKWQIVLWARAFPIAIGAESARWLRVDADLYFIIIPVMFILGCALWYHANQQPFRYEYLNTLEFTFISLDLLAMALALLHSQLASLLARTTVATLLSVICAWIIMVPFILLFISLRDPEKWWVDLDLLDGSESNEGIGDRSDEGAKTETKEVAMTPLARKPSKELASELAAITKPTTRKGRKRGGKRAMKVPSKEEYLDSV